ncbi:MAG: hypothetical protein ABI254_04495 [Chthoniobacterales bacterium]
MDYVIAVTDYDDTALKRFSKAGFPPIPLRNRYGVTRRGNDGSGLRNISAMAGSSPAMEEWEE